MIPVYNMLVSLWREVPDCEELVWGLLTGGDGVD